MGSIRLAGNPDIEIHLRRSPRARRLSLRVSRLDGRVTLTLPQGVREGAATRFAEDQAGWIVRALARQAVPQQVGIGAEVPVAGRAHAVAPGAGRAARIDGGRILAPPERAGPSVRALLKALARDAIAAEVDRLAAALGREAGRITLRDTRSRWGSCSERGDLMFSWRIVMAPADVMTYLVAHEVAHLAHMDHSPRFWATVGRLMPGYEAPRHWLRHEGHTLHRWRFDAAA